MLIHNFWETVLGSKVKIKILRVLSTYPIKRFTVRELARLAQSSHTPVLKSLPDLQEMNLIRMEKHGTANLITLNPKSKLVLHLKNLFATETSFKDELKKKIAKIVPKSEMIVLFGSVARGNEKMNSDIDVLIISNNKKKIEYYINEARKKITEEFGNLISPMILTEKEFKAKQNQPFAKDLIKSYEIISGKDLIKR